MQEMNVTLGPSSPFCFSYLVISSKILERYGPGVRHALPLSCSSLAFLTVVSIEVSADFRHP